MKLETIYGRVLAPNRRRVDPIHVSGTQRVLPRRRSLAARVRLARAGYRPDHADALALAACAAAAVVSMLLGGGR